MKRDQIELRMKNRLKIQGKAHSTFRSYWQWCQRFLDFCKTNSLGSETKAESAVEQWLTYLAIKRRVSKTTQNCALNAVCYLYREVFDRPLEGVSAIRAKKPSQARDVLDVSEVAALFGELSGTPLLFSQLIYGCGLRIGDVAQLRVKDISFERCQLSIHSGKGDKGRYTSFPEVIHDAVSAQMEDSRRWYEWDQQNNPNGVSLPNAFRRKSPRAGASWPWYYLFCSGNLSRLDDGPLCRHHKHTGNISREIKRAAERAQIPKRVTSHILRHCYATHANEAGVDVTTLQTLLGHTHIDTTMIYVHANKDRATASKSPLSRILANPPRIHKTKDRLRIVG